MHRMTQPPPFRSQRPVLLFIVALAALTSAATFSGLPREEGLQPLALFASLLPLQLAALIWGLARLR
jgi:uncharacterized membrane protein YhhN